MVLPPIPSACDRGGDDGGRCAGGADASAMIVAGMLVAMVVLFIVFAVRLWAIVATQPAWPRLEAIALGGVVNFFDALGVGSFASTTCYLRFRRLVPIESIPGLMIVAFAAPTVAEAMIFTHVIPVDRYLLVACVLASCVGSLLGVSVALHLPARGMRIMIGVGLLTASAIFVLTNLDAMPQAGTATGLSAAAFATVVAVSGVLGILANLGVGSFAPTLVTFLLLGFDPRAAFPIMMASAAFTVLVSGLRLLERRTFDMRIVTGLAIGGLVGVLIGALVVKSLPMAAVRWGVVLIATWAGATLLLDTDTTGDAVQASTPTSGAT